MDWFLNEQLMCITTFFKPMEEKWNILVTKFASDLHTLACHVGFGLKQMLPSVQAVPKMLLPSKGVKIDQKGNSIWGYTIFGTTGMNYKGKPRGPVTTNNHWAPTNLGRFPKKKLFYGRSIKKQVFRALVFQVLIAVSDNSQYA